MTNSDLDMTIDTAVVRRNFLNSCAFLVGSFVLMNLFTFAVKGMGGLGPVTFPISIAIVVVLIASYIWFLIQVYRSAKVLGFGSGAALLALLAIVPLFAFIIAIWLPNKFKEQSEATERHDDA